ncbi:MAG: Sec-independent protein translocase protein TatB [Beijerinckiaceae bacterium]
MFDIDAGKLLILGVIALVVLGPKELPRVMRQVGSALGKMRRMAAEFQTQFMDAMKESEMEELKKDMQKMADQAKVDINYDPVSETNRQIRDAIEGKPGVAEIPAGTPVPSDPDPDNKIYTADLPPVEPQAPAAEAPAVPAHVASDAPPARKAGEA